MSADVSVSLRALVLRDVAEHAARHGRLCAARLLRRAARSSSAPEVAEDIAVVREELGGSSAPGSSSHARALARLIGGDDRGAVGHLAYYAGLTPAEWVEETCREQGVPPAMRPPL